MTANRSLLADAQRIWRAGLEAVRPERLLAEAIRREGDRLVIENGVGQAAELDLKRLGRLIIVGGGKAGASMAQGLEAALGPLLPESKQPRGFLSVPGGCAEPTESIRLVEGRPAGVNEPRAEGEAAAREMLDLVSQAGPDDVCLCLLSGGGSALLPAPEPPVTLEAKLLVTQLLSAGGAAIEQLNTVRQHLSLFKGGGLARACRAGRLVTLVLSDVLGDPLDLIASGPTIQPKSTPADALAILEDFGLADRRELEDAVALLKQKSEAPKPPPPSCECQTLILANNATAVDAAGVEAEKLGYRHAMDCARQSEGPAEEVGRQLAEMALSMRDAPEPHGPNCLITGGEPTVELAPSEVRGKGGRNQQLVLAAMERLGDARGVALLSGGTDGEDGPTDAAGAMVDQEIAQKANRDAIADSLHRNDAYRFFEPLGGLLVTGPTHTNVCDLRVVTVDKVAGG